MGKLWKQCQTLFWGAPKSLQMVTAVMKFLCITFVKILIIQNSGSKIIAFGPITSWEIDGETVETVSDFIFFGSKITADGGCSHEIKRRLLLGRKVMTNVDNIFRDGNGNPLRYSCLENPMDRGAWYAAVHGVAKIRTRLSDFTFTFHFHAL